jgi:hypothetical protein
MLRKALRAVIVAVFIAVPFAVGVPQADAACQTVGDATFCGDPAGAVNVEIPGLLHVCIRLQATCP